MSLQKQAFSGVVWTFIETFLIKGLTFIVGIYLARILGPADFGLIGMLAIFIGVGTTLVDSGLSSSLIRTPDANHKDFTTVFYVNLLISLVIYGIVFAIAPWVGEFYNQPILVDIMRVYCLSFIISAFSAVQLAILNKKMLFKQIMFLTIPGVVIGSTAGVYLGYIDWGVWSLVYMHLVTQLIFTVVLWLKSSWKPNLSFSMTILKKHFNFGYKLMLSGLLDKVFSNAYHVVIGKYFSIESLGYFERAQTINRYPANTITGILSKVTFPLLAGIQNDKAKIKEVYKRILQFSFSISAPLMLGSAAIAKPLLLILLGEKWLPAVPLFQIFCFSAILIPIHAFNINVLKVYGRSDLFLKLEIYKKVLIGISILCAYPFGVFGIAWSMVVVSVLALLINTYYSNRILHYKTISQLKDITIYFILAILMALVMFALVSYLPWSNAYLVATASIVGIVLYLSLNMIFKTSSLTYGKELLKALKK